MSNGVKNRGRVRRSYIVVHYRDDRSDAPYFYSRWVRRSYIVVHYRDYRSDAPYFYRKTLNY
ncbi:hypothetical protein K4039_06660 [Lyngbya sp. CCAP 1446/10]|uniref:hypothetical protein n=1 Tax=Lyngbya sp. CCAP 1446/10 TaxID=439293 RepID=UPI0022378E73|nr:hypothetical protein [Lyngbya sp. CCAP 1446/10]MCW6049770.1 hypothetical protein [Lyngbya sp. CCAP 1446/10]